ncbi:conserved hypothetical protein [Methanolacinia petrolearia DSM 11571]|uniref:Archaeal Type IV pilin N-terminal domain-containing protein n=1 Tax=Methanolacinia petrolearia (strain DSM 11571 / OCM 486 / SEBR 4847) TaxID=679926 RepID=E1RKM6_METP4|nr:hypothetical protein [Methanolacinia petrolearia]ADN36965.1 conserved hypothetical protein [Methanolacinia petrolearia DSM 11571]
MKKDTERAVSTVVAMMLILAILATCVAVYTSTYVPGLKQQSEILHNKDVRYSFLRFSADVENIYSIGRPAQFSEPLILGGGDILLSASESGGRIDLANTTVGMLTIYENGIAIREIPVETVCVSYTPYFSSWELQGYRYENGTVWVTKDNTDKIAPASLSLNSVGDGTDNERKKIEDRLSYMAGTYEENAGSITMQIITMTLVSPDSVSGSGSAALSLDARNSGTPLYTHTFSDDGTIVMTGGSGFYRSFSVSTGDNLEIDCLEVEVSVV